MRQLPHAQEWMLFEKNIGSYAGLEETSFSKGEIYTILINKKELCYTHKYYINN